MKQILSDRPIVPDYLLRVRLSMLFCMIVFAFVLSLNHQLLTLVLKSRGFDETAIGISAGMAPLGILISSLYITWATNRMMASYVAIGGLLLSIFAMLFLYLFDNYYVWLFLRFCLGIGINVTFIIGEAWVNESAKEKSRSKTLAIYMTLLSLGFATGPGVIALTGIDSFLPYAISIGCSLLALAPIFYFRYRYPNFPEAEHKLTPWSFLPLAPILLFSILIVTMMDQSLLALLSLYGLSYGLLQDDAVLLVAYLVLGTVLLQYPIGIIADKLTNRRIATLGCAIISMVCLFLIPSFMKLSSIFYIPLIVLTGGFGFAIYTLGMTELGARFSGAYLLAGTACFSLLWGIGGVIAPPFSGLLMEHYGSDSLLYFNGALYLVLSIIICFRLRNS